MSIDFNYLKYKLKEYLISDFTFDEISKVLNDVEVGNEAEIVSSNLDGVKVENSAKVGPFAVKAGK